MPVRIKSVGNSIGIGTNAFQIKARTTVKLESAGTERSFLVEFSIFYKAKGLYVFMKSMSIVDWAPQSRREEEEGFPRE